jgi:hypothetical protein
MAARCSQCGGLGIHQRRERNDTSCIVTRQANCGVIAAMHQHRGQLEYELREKVILLRQSLIAALGNTPRMWELMLRSLPAFSTLFRHALLELGEPATGSKSCARS